MSWTLAIHCKRHGLAQLLKGQINVHAALLASAAPERGADFWRSIARAQYAVPAGESAAGLLGEFDELFASRDAALRDGLGYGIAEQWILCGSGCSRPTSRAR
jgi:hypothetical protein